MNNLIQLAWCVLLLAISGYGLSRIVGFEEGQKLSARSGVVAVLVLLFIEPMYFAISRVLSDVTRPSVGDPALTAERVATSPFVVALGFLVLLGHGVFVLFLWRLRARLRVRSRERIMATVRGRERVEGQASNERDRP